MKMRFKKLHPDAKVPNYAHPTDAGMDMYTIEDFTIAPGEHYNAHTGIALALPSGHAGLIWDKSGISMKRHVKTVGGVFDDGYRGEYIIGLVNLGTEPQSFKAGDKICQILIQKIEQPDLVEVEDFAETTNRGEGRWGSTGHN